MSFFVEVSKYGKNELSATKLGMATGFEIKADSKEEALKKLAGHVNGQVTTFKGRDTVYVNERFYNVYYFVDEAVVIE